MATTTNRVLGTAGHIDHGKTALVRALTGVDTDRLPAEKARGITIDLGFAALDLDGVHLSMVDVPGHERFIRNMLAGATGLDLAMLVLAADDSVMPQTREHLEILELLGLKGGVVALSKCDMVDPDWLALVEEDVRRLVTGTFLEGAPIVRTSAVTGMGLEELKGRLREVAIDAPERDDPGRFRLAVDRSFTVAGHGTVVTGTVASGTVGLGDELECWPESRKVRVRGLQQHERPVEQVSRGARAALNLAGIHHTEVERGHELAAPGYLRASRVLTVELRGSRDAPRAIRHRGRYRLHLGTREVGVTVGLLEGSELRGGQAVLAQLFMAAPVVAVHGEPFVLREESPPATLGGGMVIQPTARRIRRRDTTSRERLAGLCSPDPARRAAAALTFAGLNPWSDAELGREAGLAASEVSAVRERLAGRGQVVELAIGSRRTAQLLATAVSDLEDRVIRALGRLHAARPRQTAIRRSHLAAALPDLDSDALVGAVLDRLTKRGDVLADARTVALRDHKPKLSQAERKLKEELAAAIGAGGFTPPDAGELARLAGARAGVLAELLVLLADEGRIVEVAEGIYLESGHETELRRRVLDRLSKPETPTMTMAELRDLIGSSRKFAVPVGEYLDRIGWTRREGDLRKLGPAAGSNPVEPPR